MVSKVVYNSTGHQQSLHAVQYHRTMQFSFTELKMQLSLVFCLAQVLCCYLLCTRALPMAVEEGGQLVEKGLSAGDNPLNDYMQAVSRRLLENGCISSYNGRKISPHLCKTATIKTFEALKLGLLQEVCCIHYKWLHGSEIMHAPLHALTEFCNYQLLKLSCNVCT